MEQRKRRNKKGDKHQQAAPRVVSNASHAKPAQTEHVAEIKKLTPEDYDYTKSDKSQFAHLKHETKDADEVSLTNNAPRMIVSNWQKYEEIPDTEDSGKDFQSLLNAPVSAGGHFVFKSERNWAVEITKYSDLFSLNIKKLATAIDSIPFTDYIDVEDRYFTKDQLTKIQNETDKSKTIYADLTTALKNAILDERKNLENDRQSETPIETSNENRNECESPAEVEDDLDFLLSLTKPVKNEHPKIVLPIQTTSREGNLVHSTPASVKSIDLEKWLDSVLDD